MFANAASSLLAPFTRISYKGCRHRGGSTVFRICMVVLVVTIAWWLNDHLKAKAQGGGGALVLTTCGTLPLAYPVGATRAVTVDVNGNLCT